MPGSAASTLTRWLVALLSVSLLGAGCGARWSEEQRGEVASRYGPGHASGEAVAAGPSTAGAGARATVGAAAGVGTADETAPTATTAGNGPVRDAAGPQATARPCSEPAEAPGVTDGTITVATINTVSGPVPGLGATSEAAVRSYVAYRNSLGGICGRQLELVTADDGADSSRFRAIVVDLAPRVLGFVGTFAAGDGGGAGLVEEGRIPVVGAASTTEFQDVSTVFDTNPPPADLHAVIPKFEYLIDQGVRDAAVVTLANAAAVAELDVHQAQMEAAGIKIVSRQVLPLSTLSFDSAARAVANSGADYLFFLASENYDASMAQSMRDTGYQLLFEEYLTGYGQLYLDLAGGAAEGTSSWIRFLPTEDGGVNPEQAAFLRWMEATAPGVAADVYAAAAWAGTKAFVDALEQLPGPISREALIAQLRATTSFDADGFFGNINLGEEHSNGCLIGMRVEGGRWRRITPADGFLC